MTLAVIDRGSQAEIQLELFSRLAFQTPDPLGLGRSQLAHKALHRLIGIGEAVFARQILVNTLGAEPELHLSHDHCGQGFALTLSPNAIADGRNGWFYFTASFFKASGRNGWFCLASSCKAGGRNGWFYFTSFFKPGGRNGWFCLASFFKPGGRNGWFCFTSFLKPGGQNGWFGVDTDFVCHATIL